MVIQNVIWINHVPWSTYYVQRIPFLFQLRQFIRWTLYDRFNYARKNKHFKPSWLTYYEEEDV